MDLERAGSLFNLDKFKERLKKRFPDYNFDVPPPPDTRCKAPFYCSKNEIKYTDTEGNLYCGYRFKLADEKNPFSFEWKVCHALIQPVDVQEKHKEDEVELF
jgi:hypothetical protein